MTGIHKRWKFCVCGAAFFGTQSECSRCREYAKKHGDICRRCGYTGPRFKPEEYVGTAEHNRAQRLGCPACRVRAWLHGKTLVIVGGS